ncbi:MAG TPA: ABC transporter permease [Rhizomicrobium sp.]|nr:ABC transporter permease [Rhizomicrobium sp.]
MASLRQFLGIMRLSARSFPGRAKSSLVIVIGLACVTAVPLSLITVGESLKNNYIRAGAPDRAIVLSQGARTQSGSRISPLWADTILHARGIRQWHGQVLAGFEISAGFQPLKRAKPEKGNATIRGIGPLGFVMRPEFKLLSGRLPKPGSQDAIVGLQAQRKFAGFDIGHQIEAVERRWQVVGVFETGNTLDGDVVADAGALKAAKHRDGYNIARVALKSPDRLEDFRESLRALPVRIVRETDYYTQLWSQVPDIPYFIAYALLLLMGGGALSGTVHTVYAATGARAHEIVILRAIGFNGALVAASVVVEAVLLACLGALIGVGVDWLWLDGYPYNGGMEGGVFPVHVTWRMAALALGWAIVIGIWGALMPSFKVARGTVVEAMREL